MDVGEESIEDEEKNTEYQKANNDYLYERSIITVMSKYHQRYSKGLKRSKYDSRDTN